MPGGRGGAVADAVHRRFPGEVGRRLVHASGAVIPLSHVLGLPWPWLQAALIGGVAVAAVLEFHRLRSEPGWWIYRTLTREYESDAVAGYALYVLGMAVVALAFPSRIALPAMFMLAVADPIGGVLGGAEPVTLKRPRALVGAFAVSLAVALPFLAPVPAVAGAAAASLADGVFLEVRGHVVDDNLTIPIAAAMAVAVTVTVWPV